MILIEHETPRDWIALCVAATLSWCRRIHDLIEGRGQAPPWAGIPPAPGSVRYVEDKGRDTWTFGDGKTGHEGATFGLAEGDCDSLMPMGAGARLALSGKCRIVTVARENRGHTFETAFVAGPNGYRLTDMSVWGGMTPLSREDYNMAANVALIRRDGMGYHIDIAYGIPPNADTGD